ncbi:MAG: hypothetical protein ACYDCH_08015 [Gaiellaceae bacterium]
MPSLPRSRPRRVSPGGPPQADLRPRLAELHQDGPACCNAVAAFCASVVLTAATLAGMLCVFRYKRSL